MNSFLQLNVGVENDEGLVALTKKLKNLAKSEKAVSRNAQELTSRLNAQSAAAQRAAGQMRFLEETSRNYTAQTQGLQKRASEIGNITGELDALQQSQQNIQNFEQLLGETGLTMSGQGDIIEDSRQGLRDALAGEGPGRSQVIDQLQQGREVLQGRKNLREKIGSMKAPEMDRMLQQARPRMEQTMITANAAAEGMAELGGRTKESNRAFGKMFGVGMNLMFMGMALQQVFGSLVKSMLKMTGTSKVFGAAAKSTLLPFFLQIAPLLNKVAFFFMNLSKPIKMVLGAFVSLIAVMGTFLFFGAQVGIMAATISGSFMALSASLLVIVAGLAIVSLAMAGIVMLFEQGNRVLGAFMTLVAAAAAAVYAFGLRTAFSKGLLGPLNKALTTVGDTFSKLGVRAKLAALKTKFFSLTAGKSKGQASGLKAMLAPLTLAFGAVATAAQATAAKLGLISAAQEVYNVVAAKTGAVMSFVNAQFAALSISLSSILLVVGSLALGIFLLNRVFKKFGPVVGLLATILGAGLLAILSPIAAVVLGIFGAFKAVNKIFKKFGKVAGLIAGIIVVVIAVIIGIFASVPIAIGLAIGAVIAVIWNFKDEIMAGLKKAGKIVSGFVDSAVQFFKKLPGRIRRGASNLVETVTGFFKDIKKDGINIIQGLIDFVTDLPSKIKNGLVNLGSAMSEIGKSLIDGIVDGIRSVGGKLKDVFFNQLPAPLSTAIKGISSFSGNLMGSITDVLTPNDFILTSGGKMIQPAANDTIVGFNGEGPIQPGGGGGEVTVNINDPVMKEDVDVQQVVDEVEDRVNRDSRGRSGGL